MTDIKERLRIVSQSPRSFDTALLKDALGEIERLEVDAARYKHFKKCFEHPFQRHELARRLGVDDVHFDPSLDEAVDLSMCRSQKEPT
jgi:hypothetical protein